MDWPTYDSSYFNYGFGTNGFTQLGNYFYESTYSGVWLTTGGDTYWNPMNTGLTNIRTNNIDAVQSIFASSNTLFAGHPIAVFTLVSNPNPNAKWNLPIPVCHKRALGAYRTILAIAGLSPYILAGTEGAGIYKTTNSGTQWYDSEIPD